MGIDEKRKKACLLSQVGQGIVYDRSVRELVFLRLSSFSLSNVERLNGGNSSSSSWRLSVLRNYPLWETALLVDRNQFSLITMKFLSCELYVYNLMSRIKMRRNLSILKSKTNTS